MEVLNNILQVFSAVLAVLYFFRDIAIYLYKKIVEKRLTYNALHDSHIRLINKINQEYSYNLVFILNIHGFFIPNLVYDLFKTKNILHIYCVKKENHKKSLESELIYTAFDKIKNEKWTIYLPKVLTDLNNLEAKKDYKVLILDDFCISGNSLSQIKSYFKNLGIIDIKTASLFISDVCKHNNSEPDFYDKIMNINIKTPYDKIR